MRKWWNKIKNYIRYVTDIRIAIISHQFVFALFVCLAFAPNVRPQEFDQNLWQPPWPRYSINSSYSNGGTGATTIREPMLYSVRSHRHRLRFRDWPASRGRTKSRGLNRKTNQKRAKYRGLLGSLEESIELIDSKYIHRRIDPSKEDQIVEDRFGDCSLYPNNTFISPFAFTCETHDEQDGIAPPAIVVHEAAFSNATGDYVYPLDFTQTMRIFLDVTSFATRKYDNLRAEITAYRRKVGWQGCGWSFVPTFGTLDAVEICDENNPSCPVYPGRQVLELKMESGPTTTRLLRLLHDERVPYQLRLRVFNNRGRGEELFCLMFQARIEV